MLIFNYTDTDVHPPAHSSPCKWGLRPWRPLRHPVCAKRWGRRSRGCGWNVAHCYYSARELLSLDPSHPQWAFRPPLAQNPNLSGAEGDSRRHSGDPKVLTGEPSEGLVSPLWPGAGGLRALQTRGKENRNEVGLLGARDQSRHEVAESTPSRSPEPRSGYGQMGGFSLGLSLYCLASVIPWTEGHQAPLSMGFSRQEYWSGLPVPSSGDLPNPRIEPLSPELQVDSLLLSHQRCLGLNLPNCKMKETKQMISK